MFWKWSGSGAGRSVGTADPVVAPDTNALRRPTAILPPPSKFRRHRQRSGPCGRDGHAGRANRA